MAQASVHKLSASHRAGRAIGATATTAGLAVALLGAFAQTAAPLWMEPSPEVMEQVTRCQALPPRQGRETCRQRMASTRLQDLQRGVQVADRQSTRMAR